MHSQHGYFPEGTSEWTMNPEPQGEKEQTKLHLEEIEDIIEKTREFFSTPKPILSEVPVVFLALLILVPARV